MDSFAAKLNKPLIRRFWPAVPVDDPNPHHVFRPREKERYKLRGRARKNDMDMCVWAVYLNMSVNMSVNMNVNRV